MNKNFTIENFGKKDAFASFLPGIAGIKGMPIWCYYVNRGQGVVSFGVDNKDHSIMEFYPAHMAYQNVKRTGFRTFVKRGNDYLEPFSNERVSSKMIIEKNLLSIEEDNQDAGLTTRVSYYVLPEEKVGALVREVEIINTGDKADFEILDGMPNVIPYGVGIDSMKNMTQTAKAWMQVEDHVIGLPFYRVRVSMDDTAQVSEMNGGNFALAINEKGDRLAVVVDSEAIFGYDLSLGYPVNFAESGMNGIDDFKENTSNLLPACFFKRKATLSNKEGIKFYEVIGQVADKSLLDEFVLKVNNVEFFEKKKERARLLTTELTDVIATKTASREFDEYTRYTYMDNVLRGGTPIKLSEDKIFYVYSRKHGDLERDYNYFSMLPEYYSQGNGNFRDVNQNRRCDSFFSGEVKAENIKTFYSLIQLDGYNPLGIEKITYRHKEIDTPFTPGQLYMLLLKKYDESRANEEFERIIFEASGGINANFGEGYWSDHWTYNLDLIEEFLEIYPDKHRELFLEKDYKYFLAQAVINKRSRRYAKTDNGIRQYYALDEERSRNTADKWVAVNGEVYKGSLMEKLMLLSTLKFGALDPYGMGVEMEGGKPGWYDALNGLPGMLGSSMAETYELKRMVEFTLNYLRKNDLTTDVFVELYELMNSFVEITKNNVAVIENDLCISDFWNQINDAKESYRDTVFEGISGGVKSVNSSELIAILEAYNLVLTHGIKKATKINGTIVPTYFSYEVTDYTEDEDGIHPVDFKVVKLPDFLEGPVRYLKLGYTKDEKLALFNSVKNSDLYDKKLDMYKVNAKLETASFEIGRCRAFTPGWLENESIWLHMEYKYLLELLRSGLYKEFAIAFKNAAVPFLDEKIYGRSIYENSSFIVSSANPNEKIHGKGFVARLSGSTIEFISMWKLLMFGNKPFTYDGEKLALSLNPFLPEYLVPEDLVVETTFMGDVKVTYSLCEKKDYEPGFYTVNKYEITYKDGRRETVEGPVIEGLMAEDIRDKKVSKIEAFIK